MSLLVSSCLNVLVWICAPALLTVRSRFIPSSKLCCRVSRGLQQTSSTESNPDGFDGLELNECVLNVNNNTRKDAIKKNLIARITTRVIVIIFCVRMVEETARSLVRSSHFTTSPLSGAASSSSSSFSQLLYQRADLVGHCKGLEHCLAVSRTCGRGGAGLKRCQGLVKARGGSARCSLAQHALKRDDF
jgi:hypothetical protein